MTSIRDLYLRFRQLIHEGFKFLVVGAIGAVVTFGAANVLQPIGNYKAITIATILATVVTYLGNRYWSFTKRQGHGTARESTIFVVLNGIGLLIYYGCIWLIHDEAGLQGKIWYNFALVVGTGLGTLFRFWSYRKWVWTAPGGAPGGGWTQAFSDGVPSGTQRQPGPPAAEALPANPPSPLNRPWNGPKHRAPVGRR